MSIISIKSKFKLHCNKCKDILDCLTFYTGTKIPLIPPLVINYQLITDFREKVNFFNLHFAKQCTPTENDTERNLVYATISAVDFEDQDILNIIRALDINTTHGHDHILTHMIKTCDSSIAKPLPIIFRNSLDSGIFPDNQKIPNIVQPTKTKQVINKKLSSCVIIAIVVRLIFNPHCKFVKENSLVCSSQSGFR